MEVFNQNIDDIDFSTFSNIECQNNNCAICIGKLPNLNILSDIFSDDFIPQNIESRNENLDSTNLDTR